MIEEIIAKLFQARGLGKVCLPIEPVSGGLMHRMYKVKADDRVYAVKHLNPGIMERPDALMNFRRADELEQVLEDSGIPMVPALVLCGSKLQEYEGAYLYVFRWQNGRTADWNHITEAQCRKAGELQGRIHAIRPVRKTGKTPEPCDIDWRGYIEEAERQRSALFPVLKESEALLQHALEELNQAYRALPDMECITDGDMDPKNVMWDGDQPYVIDLECLDYGNPVSDAMQLSLQWAGITTCTLDLDKLRAFFEGYLNVYDNGFRDYAGVFGLSYFWADWLEYNVRRALGEARDEEERALGEQEAKNTVDRIRTLYEKEEEIKAALRGMF